MPETRPCPFCGEDPTKQDIFVSAASFWVECLTCNARGPTATDRDHAANAWNDRIADCEIALLQLIARQAKEVREAQIEYYNPRKRKPDSLNRSKALERRLDELLQDAFPDPDAQTLFPFPTHQEANRR